jgi:hypothetical protein
MLAKRFDTRGGNGKGGTMDRDSARDDRLTVVPVDEATEGAIVPAGGDTLLPVPRGSVTVEAIRRAARRIGEPQRRRSFVVIAEATLNRQRASS